MSTKKTPVVSNATLKKETGSEKVVAKTTTSKVDEVKNVVKDAEKKW